MASTRAYVALCLLLSGAFWTRACYSMMAPFFPILAEQKGLTTGEYSIVFGLYSVSSLVGALFVGKLISVTGAKFILLSSLFLTGGASILFGVMEFSLGGKIFLVLCCFIRMFEGAGFRMFLNATVAVMVKLFPSNPSFSQGLTLVAAAAGTILGLPIGTMAYSAFGYFGSFTILGIIVLALIIPVRFILNTIDVEHQDNDESPVGIQDYCFVLSSTSNILSVISAHIMSLGYIYVLINLERYIKGFKLNSVEITGVYITISIFGAVSSLVTGKILDKVGHELLFQCLSSILGGIGYLIFSFNMLFSFEINVALMVCALAVIGFAFGATVCCAFSGILKNVNQRGMPLNLQTYGLVSSIEDFFVVLGEILGSVISTIFGDAISISTFCIYPAGLNFLLAMFYLILYVQKLWSSSSKWRKIFGYELLMKS